MRAGRPVFEAFRGHSTGRSSKTLRRPRSRRALALPVPLLLLLSACASDAISTFDNTLGLFPPFSGGLMIENFPFASAA